MGDSSYLPFEPRGNYIDGAFRLPKAPDGTVVNHNPGDPDDRIGEFPWTRASVAEAVGAAKRALPAWRELPPERRAEFLRAYARALEQHRERLAEAISRSMGKVLWEARTEVAAMISKVAITLDDGMKLVADFRPPGVKGIVRYRPRGVLAVIGPFNFPGHLPNGHVVPALATGNTVVFKTANQTLAVGQIMAECIHEAGFPAGVFNLIQAPGRQVGDPLVMHPDVDGVLFTGSTSVGQRIQELTLKQSSKICALEMGGKNAAVVLDDAPFDQSLYEVVTGAFLTTGQRCTATSRVILQRGIADRFIGRMAEVTRNLRIGVQHDPEIRATKFQSDPLPKRPNAGLPPLSVSESVRIRKW
jgi:succinylglutamic semialdehyde dehydrogenase